MAETFREPQSANEALLQNILGAENETREPQSVTEYYLQKIVEQGGGESEILHIHYFRENGSYKCSHSYDEIESAIQNNKYIIATIGYKQGKYDNDNEWKVVTSNIEYRDNAQIPNPAFAFLGIALRGDGLFIIVRISHMPNETVNIVIKSITTQNYEPI